MKSNIEWKMWGKTDPLYGVAAWPGKQLGGVSPWSREDFYSLGRSDWEDFLGQWLRFGVDDGDCVEVGCGAGRLTGPMTEFFRTVHALDVSEGMIDCARQNAGNAQFHLVGGSEIPLADDSVSAVFSAHVFQHFDSLDHATAYFAEIRRVLKPAGTVMIHLPILSWPQGVGTLLPKIHSGLAMLASLKAGVQRWRIQRGSPIPYMRGLSYPIQYLYESLGTLGFSDIEIRIFAVRSNGAPHPFLFARRR